jgi:cobalt-precorrin 5A hydrolase
MDMGQAMMVAGFGFRAGVTATEIRRALDTALDGLIASRTPDHLATAAAKAGEHGLVAAAIALGISVLPVSQQALEAASGRASTRSARSLGAMNVPSVAECAALAAGGPSARLLVTRVVVGPVTCALAEKEGQT